MDLLADAEDFLAYVSASPSPRHCVAETARRLEAAGFSGGTPADGLTAGFATRGGSLLAWRSNGDGPTRVVTAHTDSPNLRVKPRPDVTGAGIRQVGVEVYGGVLLNSWLDRDLGLAGHVIVRTDDGIETRLALIDRAVLRIPQLAIHLDRDISSKGLLLNRQQHMKPMWGMAGEDDERTLADLLAAELDVEPDAILAHELMTFDLTPPAIGGWDDDFIASPRIDNQLSCWAATAALASTEAPGTQVIALFDHEEVGSTSSTGADSNMLADALGQLVGDSPSEDSLCISADCAHATHPNYADRHDPEHQIALNGGPVVKVNANERYATTPLGHALFVDACERAEVPHQVFVNRTDLACGSTVGPVTAARTGLDTVDVGAPQLAMHSARETTGASDPGYLRRALSAVFG
ncbi:MAG: M18 family aminopeptidase [Actinomycetota bacterium]